MKIMWTGAFIPTITIFSLTIIAKQNKFWFDKLTYWPSIFSLGMIKVTKVRRGHLVKLSCLWKLHKAHCGEFIEPLLYWDPVGVRQIIEFVVELMHRVICVWHVKRVGGIKILAYQASKFSMLIKERKINWYSICFLLALSWLQ